MKAARLRRSTLVGASFSETNLSSADLTEADLTRSTLDRTVFKDATLTGARVYGASVWNVTLESAQQQRLVITLGDEQEITVDDLELAQFIYMMLNNRSLRRVIDTITSKVVLILGSFSDERKPILDAMRDALRGANYTPILFDFEKPANRDMTETLSTLAHMARFVIADLTDAKSIRQELERIVPDLPSVPVQPLLLATEELYAMFDHNRSFRSVLPLVRYRSAERLMMELRPTLIPFIEAAVEQLRRPADDGRSGELLL